jgi:hypothetical protein
VFDYVLDFAVFTTVVWLLHQRSSEGNTAPVSPPTGASYRPHSTRRRAATSRLEAVASSALDIGIRVKRGKPAPAATAPASKPTPAKTKAKTGKRGRKEYDVWKPMFDYLDKIAETGKKFSSYSAAAQVGHYWLTEQQASRSQRKEGAAVPTVDTVRVKIRKLRPDLASG